MFRFRINGVSECYELKVSSLSGKQQFKQLGDDVELLATVRRWHPCWAKADPGLHEGVEPAVSTLHKFLT
jgi:hypothetical protein